MVSLKSHVPAAGGTPFQDSAGLRSSLEWIPPRCDMDGPVKACRVAQAGHRERRSRWPSNGAVNAWVLPQSRGTSGCRHPVESRARAASSEGLSLGLLERPRDSPPEGRAVETLRRSALGEPGLQLGIEVVPLLAQPCGLGSEQSPVHRGIELHRICALNGFKKVRIEQSVIHGFD